MDLRKKLNMLRFLGIAWGVGLFLFASQEILSRLNIEISGKIVTAEKVHPEKGKFGNLHRYYMKYSIENPRDQIIKYRAKGSDSHLSRELSVGAYIKKEKWSTNYTVNDNLVSDFPVAFYNAILLIGAALLATGFSAHFKIKKT